MLHHMLGWPARLVAMALVAMTLVVGGGEATLADDDDRARTPATAASIDAVLATVQRDYPGRVLKVELEREDDAPSGWAYEVKVLTTTGEVVEIELDAVSLNQLRAEGARSRHSDED